MGQLLYINGVIEEFVPKNKCFNEEELISLFKDFKKLRSKRLYEVPNCWCLWGEKPKPNELDFNRLASDIVEENVFSPIFFFHDSELNPEWNISDNILYNSYDQFKKDLYLFIDNVAESILKERDEREQNGETKKDLLVLKSLGVTKDKRLLFNFIPKDQDENFYSDESFKAFASRIFEYLTNNFIPMKPFVLFADNKMVISLLDEDVDQVIDKIIEPYAKNEDYESCNKLAYIKHAWHEAVDVKESPKKKKLKRKKKTIKNKSSKKTE